MSDEKQTPPDNVTPLSAAKLSKSKVKKLFNASLARVHQETSSDRHARAELDEAQQRLSNACAVLEAVVRRHGPQTFDRAELESVCKFGSIAWDITPTRITLRLRSDGS